MDQEKIGKLIAKLRKNKGLTQSELGDMVGVGFRAVSKWETGLTSPDISIINDLSKILGISADELLNGELNKNSSNTSSKFNIRNLFYIIPIALIVILVITILNMNSNKTEIYKLETIDKEYYIEGEIVFKGKNLLISINKIGFMNETISAIIINNYQYELYSNDTLIVGYGYTPIEKALESSTSIGTWSDNFKVKYNSKIPTDKTEMIKNGLDLKIDFISETNDEITKNIKISFIK